MRYLKSNKFSVITLAVMISLFIAVGCVANKAANKSKPATAPMASTNIFAFTPGPNDTRIAYVAARWMQEFNYSQLPLDAEMSKKIFDGYLDALDGRHENLLQSDVAEFSHYRTNLDKFLVGVPGTADLRPAYEIFQRLVERTQQHAAYVDELLAEDRFKFNTDERFLIDRRHAEFPKDLDEAKELWRQRLHYEYLMEKLSREISPTNSNVILPLTKSNYTDIADTLARHYRWNLRMVTNFDSDTVLQTYLNALTHAYDPHSDYLNTAHAQDFSINMSLSLFGIGAQLGEDDGYCTIRDLVHGGPAEKSKLLKPLDRIVAVAQGTNPPVNVVDMELGKVVQQIRGQKGTEVRLTIAPAEDHAARRVVSLIRDEIKLEDSEAKAKLIEKTDPLGGTNRIGVIDLPSFYATVPLPGNEGHSSPKFTSEDVAKLIVKLEAEKVKGIILDLRSNPGGSLEEAVKLTGLFIKDGPVVLSRNYEGQVRVSSDTDSSQLYGGPLIVLINRFSASASEIAAAALQDYGRAIIVGDTSTFGKGTVQRLDPLRPLVWPATKSATNDPGTVKITINKFYRVNGTSTQWKGVESDIVLPDPLNYRTDLESERTLENSLTCDTIRPENYDKLNLVQPYLAELQRRSAARIATNQDFAYIREDIAELQKAQTNKTVTLNEREALKERQKNSAQDKARDAERTTRKLPEVKIYDLTIENADQPGLPPPKFLAYAPPVKSAVTYEISSAESNRFAAFFQTNQPGGKIEGTTNTLGIKGSVTNLLVNASETATASTNLTTTATETPDPTLEEAAHILEDYIFLQSKNSIMTANH